MIDSNEAPEGYEAGKNIHVHCEIKGEVVSIDCKHNKTKVVETRLQKGMRVRRRQCLKCRDEYWTEEVRISLSRKRGRPKEGEGFKPYCLDVVDSGIDGFVMINNKLIKVKKNEY